MGKVEVETGKKCSCGSRTFAQTTEHTHRTEKIVQECVVCGKTTEEVLLKDE